MTRAIIEDKKIVGYEEIKDEVKVDKDLIKKRQEGVQKKYRENKGE